MMYTVVVTNAEGIEVRVEQYRFQRSALTDGMGAIAPGADCTATVYRSDVELCRFTPDGLTHLPSGDMPEWLLSDLTAAYVELRTHGGLRPSLHAS